MVGMGNVALLVLVPCYMVQCGLVAASTSFHHHVTSEPPPLLHETPSMDPSNLRLRRPSLRQHQDGWEEAATGRWEGLQLLGPEAW